MIFQSRVIFISITLGLSFLVTLFTILSFSDRHWFHSLVLLLTEFFALAWILSSLLLVIDRYQDSGFLKPGAGKVFVWLQYVFWVLNHIFELIIAIICLFPVSSLQDDYKIVSEQELDNKLALTSKRDLDQVSVEPISI